MPKSYLKWGLVLILLFVAVFFRFYKLGSIPVGIHADEASYGYDAYSLLESGRDVWDNKLPLAFRSFGEYKLNLPYLIVPFVKLFGLGTLSTRLPSAIFGLLTTLCLYQTLCLYSKNRLVSALLALIFLLSPWAFGISREFFESNVALAFYAFGFFGLSRLGRRPPDRLYWVSIASLALAGYFYAPLRFIGLGTLVLGLLLARRHFARTLLVYLLVSLPILPQYFSGIGLKRLVQERALRDFEYTLVINENRAFCGHKFCYLFWNKPTMRVESIIEIAVESLGLNYLFLDSADGYVVPPSTGPYLLYLLPFYLLGLYAVYTARVSLLALALPLAILVSSSAAKLSIYRNVVGLYLIFIVIGHGIGYARVWLRRRDPRFARLAYLSFFLLAFYFHARFLTHYFLVYAKSSTFAWSSDAQFIATYLGKHEGDYRTIIDKSAGDFGPLYYAFYNAYPPALFRARAEWTSGDPAGWTHVGKLGKIASSDKRTIENLLCEKASAPQDDLGALYVTAPLPDFGRFADFTTKNWQGDKVLHEFYNLDHLYARLQEDNPANITRLCPLETARWPK